MDQSAINKIILDSAADDPDKKLEKLEKEVMILKGSIKKLIVDIREQMNNAENPFLNIQQLQMPPQAPVIKEDPIELEVHNKPEWDEEGTEPAEEKPEPKKKDKKAAKEKGDSESDREPGAGQEKPGKKDEREDPGLPAGPERGLPRDDSYSRRELELFKEYEEQKRMLDTLKSKTTACGPAMLTGSRRIDPYTINQIMDWTRMMLRKNGSERLSDLLEMYVSTGYISDETKAIIQRMSKLMESEPARPPKKLDIKECVSDLYTLYVILNPGDKDLDSRMLNVLLNPDERY
jgi:archaellum component FlaD/FlaE